LHLSVSRSFLYRCGIASRVQHLVAERRRLLGRDLPVGEAGSWKMEEIPVHGLEELERHVQQLAEDPETPLDAKLFDEVELQLNGKSLTV